MNYQLTNDLTKDVLTLLEDPENRKIVNEGQDEFELYISDRENDIDFHSEDYGDLSRIFIKYESVDFSIGSYDIDSRYPIEGIIKDYSPIWFFTLRHCIKLLPAFDKSIWQSSLDDVDIADGHSIIEWAYSETKYTNLAEALLKCGAMTTEELETEYERLMK